MSIFSIKRLDRVLATACLSVTASSHVLATLDPKDVLTQLSPAEIEAQLPNEHPSSYYLYAGRLMKAGDKAGALRWFYIGQLRYRIYIKAHPGEDSSLFGSLNQMGTVLNRYGALHRDEWLGAIDAALAWDDTHINGPSPKEKFQSICDEQRAGLLKLKSYIVSNIDQLAAAANGREPMPTDWPTLMPITTAKDLEGVFGRWTVGSVTSVFFAVPPAGVNFFMEDELELKAISPSRLLVIVRGTERRTRPHRTRSDVCRWRRHLSVARFDRKKSAGRWQQGHRQPSSKYCKGPCDGARRDHTGTERRRCAQFARTASFLATGAVEKTLMGATGSVR